jgi:hypothetical protein
VFAPIGCGLAFAAGAVVACGGIAARAGSSANGASSNGVPCNTRDELCCDPASGVSSLPTCDATGENPSCPSGIDPIPASAVCAVKPEVCRVPSENELSNRACTLGDPPCDFGASCTFCHCACNDSDAGPLWSCLCVLC